MQRGDRELQRAETDGRTARQVLGCRAIRYVSRRGRRAVGRPRHHRSRDCGRRVVDGRVVLGGALAGLAAELLDERGVAGRVPEGLREVDGLAVAAVEALERFVLRRERGLRETVLALHLGDALSDLVGVAAEDARG